MSEDLYVAPLVGYRCWRVEVVELAHVCRLVSWTWHEIWPTKEAMRSECYCSRTEVLGIREGKNYGHTCGIYAFNSPEMLWCWMAAWYGSKNAEKQWLLSFGFLARGVVDLWGTVDEHEHGYRAEFAYPRELELLASPRERKDSIAVAKELAESYDVPVKVVEDRNEVWPPRKWDLSS